MLPAAVELLMVLSLPWLVELMPVASVDGDGGGGRRKGRGLPCEFCGVSMGAGGGDDEEFPRLEIK